MVAPWIEKAQRWLADNAARLWAAWLETPAGKNWREARYRRPRPVWPHERLAANSPYAYGFSLPDYHHDLIKAVGEGDEHTAKAIMLYEGDTLRRNGKRPRR